MEENYHGKKHTLCGVFFVTFRSLWAFIRLWFFVWYFKYQKRKLMTTFCHADMITKGKSVLMTIVEATN